MDGALSIRGLVKRWRAGVRGCSMVVEVLSGIDLDLGAGELLGVVGRPGAGKSTLLACAAGLARPDAGTIAWFGGRARGSDDVPPPGVAYVSERAVYYAFLTVREALEYYATSRDVPSRGRAADVAAVMDRVGLSTEGETPVSRLDALAHRRVTIGQALLARPRLLVIDDVFSGLDDASRIELVELIRSVHGDGVAILTATRDERTLRLATSRIAQLEGGRLLERERPVAPSPDVSLPAARVAERRH